MSTPVVRRMVMFKHGVAYLERGGPCDGPFELSFKRDEMNDVLKSLALWVARGDATIGAVAFEKPEDPEEALVRRRLAFEPGEALRGLLGSLRGRRVAVSALGARHEGEVVGIEVGRGADQADRQQLVLRASEDAVTVVDLAAVQRLELLEAPSRADLAFFVDRSRAATAGESRTIGVRLHGRAEDLRVSYVVPAPAWRVTYRVARTEDATIVMGWAIVHNPADEDLSDIDLTLTTGQPVSFVIDLYNPKNVRRVVVEEQPRKAAAPHRFERGAEVPAPRMVRASMMSPPGAPPMAFGAPAPAAPPAMAAMTLGDDEAATGSPEAMAPSMEAATSFESRGELFEYRVAAPVSLKRGGSAMVPLFSSKVDARRERLWREGAGPAPDLVLSFENTTGAVLEEGAAVVYDGALYAGEAMVPYTARGASVKLAFAKDLGVRCKRETQSRTVLSTVHLGERTYVEELRHELHHEIVAESDHAETVSLTIELPKTHGRSFDPDHAQPFEDTASYNRFAMELPPRGRASLKVVERWFEGRRMSYDQLDTRKLHAWLEERFLDRTTFEQLSEVLAALDRARQLDAQRAEVDRRKRAAWEKQTRISEQLKVLRDSGPEGELRLRYVKDLEAAQNEVNAADVEDTALAQAAEAARNRARELLHALRA